MTLGRNSDPVCGLVWLYFNTYIPGMEPEVDTVETIRTRITILTMVSPFSNYRTILQVQKGLVTYYRL
jgi:hypothetical protein